VFPLGHVHIEMQVTMAL